MKEFENIESSNKTNPLYPKEAYLGEEKEQEDLSVQNSPQNVLLPLLLQAINGNGDFDIGKVLSMLPSDKNANLGLINALSNLGKNKKKEASLKETSEKPFPKNEFIY